MGIASQAIPFPEGALVEHDTPVIFRYRAVLWVD